MRQVQIRPLTRAKISQCLPVVQLIMPEVSAEAWQHYALAHLSPGRTTEQGILAAEDDRGLVLGLLVYLIDRDLALERMMLIKHVVICDYFESGRKAVIRALFAAAEDLAQCRNCGSIFARLPLSELVQDHDLIGQVLMSLGHPTNLRKLGNAISFSVAQTDGRTVRDH